MNSSKFWVAGSVCGVVMTIIDHLVQGIIMTPMFYAKHTSVFIQTIDPSGLSLAIS